MMPWLLWALLVLGTLALHPTTTEALAALPSLSDDYAAAQLRKALEEEKLLIREGGSIDLPYFDKNEAPSKVLVSPVESSTDSESKRSRQTTKSGGGGGFGGKMKPSILPPKSATRAQKRVASAMAATIRQDGVIRLPNLLSDASCSKVREHVLQLQDEIATLAEESVESFDATDYYGVEPGRTCRTDLLLPLDETVQGALTELLGASNPLRHLFCELFPLTAPLYEVAAVITNKGSHRQTIHPDLPHKDECPLFVVFVALQDVTEAMGPTTFLRGTQHAPPPFDLADTLHDADVVVSTLKAGDGVVFDARLLHCGNANTGTTRAIFNFSFRRPDSGALGYEGSIRKGYVEKTTLGELLEVADNLNGWNSRDDGKTLESVYGSGLL